MPHMRLMADWSDVSDATNRRPQGILLAPFPHQIHTTLRPDFPPQMGPSAKLASLREISAGEISHPSTERQGCDRRLLPSASCCATNLMWRTEIGRLTSPYLSAAIGDDRSCRPGADLDGNTASGGPSLRVTRAVADAPFLRFFASHWPDSATKTAWFRRFLA